MNRTDALARLRGALPENNITSVAELNHALATAPTVGNLLCAVDHVDFIPQFMAVSFRSVMLVGRDWYVGRQFCRDGEQAVTKDGITKLWRTASGRVIGSIRIDDDADPNVRAYKATVSLQGIDGRWADFVDQYPLDLRPGSVAIQGVTEKSVRQKRSTIDLVAESKAQNRAMRNALGIRQKYTRDECEMPFIIPVAVAAPIDESNIAMMQLAQANALGIVRDLFPQGIVPPPAELAAPPDALLLADGTSIDATTAEVVGDEVPEGYGIPGAENDCPCGDRTWVPDPEAAKSIELLGCVRSRPGGCFPGKSSFNVLKHSKVSDLQVPKRPGLTTERMRQSIDGAR